MYLHLVVKKLPVNNENIILLTKPSKNQLDDLISINWIIILLPMGRKKTCSEVVLVSKKKLVFYVVVSKAYKKYFSKPDCQASKK